MNGGLNVCGRNTWPRPTRALRPLQMSMIVISRPSCFDDFNADAAQNAGENTATYRTTCANADWGELLLQWKIRSRSTAMVSFNQLFAGKLCPPDRTLPDWMIMHHAKSANAKLATRITNRTDEIPGRKSIAGMNVWAIRNHSSHPHLTRCGVAARRGVAIGR